MASARPPVVVLGLDCPTGLQTARTFAARGVDVVGVATSLRHPCARTRACRRKLVAGSDPEGLASVLLDPAARVEEGSVVVPCTDAAVLALAEHRDHLAERFRMAIPSKEVIDLQLDKARFAAFAERHDLPIPRTRVLRCQADAVDAARDMSFPCVLKPSIKTPEWDAHVGAKVLMVDSPEALVSLHDRHGQWVDALVAQEWIEGAEHDHYTCDCYLSADGEALATFVSRKLRQWPPVVGQGSLSVEHRDDTVRDLALRTLSSAGHHGQGYVEVKRDAPSDRYLIIEANVGRPTGRSAAAEKAGVELLMTLYRDVLGEPLPANRTQTYRGTKWIHVRRDVQAAVSALIEGRATVGEILRSWRGPLTCALFSVHDPLPFVADLAGALREVARAPWKGWHRIRGGRSNSLGTAPETSVGPGVHHASASRPVHDFDVEGVFRVRAEGAGPKEIAAIARVVGPPQATASQDAPDVVVRFVDELTEGRLHQLDGGAAAYGEDGVYFLDPPGGRPVARVTQAEEWGQAVIECRRGVRTVPFLSAALDLRALERGWIPLHGSAWTAGDGTGVVVTGWARSGKTGAFLAACEGGARPVGDDRILLARDGSRMIGVGRPLVVKDWHLAQLRVATPGIGRVRRVLARGSYRLGVLASHFSRDAGSDGGLWGRAPHKALDHLRTRVSVEVDPGTLNGDDGQRVSATPDVLVLLETHGDRSMAFEAVDPEHVASRIAAQVEAELLPVLRAQLAFKYAHPGRGWQAVERAPELAATHLRQATRGKRAYVVRHPYPCSPRELGQVVMDAASHHGRHRPPSHERLTAASTALVTP